jgi:hypothetical protein
VQIGATSTSAKERWQPLRRYAPLPASGGRKFKKIRQLNRRELQLFRLDVLAGGWNRSKHQNQKYPFNRSDDGLHASVQAFLRCC